MEDEANHFAACILVPERLLKMYTESLLEKSPDINEDPKQFVEVLYMAFDVSLDMMEMRHNNVPSLT